MKLADELTKDELDALCQLMEPHDMIRLALHFTKPYRVGLARLERRGTAVSASDIVDIAMSAGARFDELAARWPEWAARIEVAKKS